MRCLSTLYSQSSDFKSENKLSHATGPLLLHASYPWKVLSETMQLRGHAVLSLPPSLTLFRTALHGVRKRKGGGKDTYQFA